MGPGFKKDAAFRYIGEREVRVLDVWSNPRRFKTRNRETNYKSDSEDSPLRITNTIPSFQWLNPEKTNQHIIFLKQSTVKY